MTDIFDVISDATRRDLLERLLAIGPEGELSVGALVEQTGLSQPTVSKHLKVLREQGLVSVREEAQHRFYRLDERPLESVAGWLAAFLPQAEVPAVAPEAEAPPLFAWSGAGAGEQIGRAAATTMHQARVVLDRLQEATAQAREAISGTVERITEEAKQVLPVKPGQD